jgi:hypothetical protein
MLLDLFYLAIGTGALILAITKPLGTFMARVFEG